MLPEVTLSQQNRADCFGIQNARNDVPHIRKYETILSPKRHSYHGLRSSRLRNIDNKSTTESLGFPCRGQTDES